MTEFSRKQFEVVLEGDRDHRRIIVPGPTQSGKTFAVTWSFFRWASTYFAGHYFALCSRSESQFNNVLLRYLKDFSREHKMPLRRAEGYSWRLPSFIPGGEPNTFTRSIGNDSGAADKIFGYTLAGIIYDEYPRMPRDYVAAGETRVSVPGGKMWYTGNPEGPMHWAKTEYVDRAGEGFGVHYGFELSDNPQIDADYIKSLDTGLSGAMKRRLMYGEWAPTSGLIYEVGGNVKKAPPIESATRFEVAFDDASSRITHALLIAYFPQGRWVVDEWRHDGAESGKRDPFWKARQIVARFAPGKRHIAWWVGDPAAQNMRNAIEMEGTRIMGLPVKVDEADNDVLPGLQLTDSWLRLRRVYIDPSCRELLRELYNYSWDEKAAQVGEDRPVKEDDHGADALRYWAYTKSAMGTGPRRGPQFMAPGGRR